MRQTTKRTVAKARALRRAMTPPEIRLWQILRSRPSGFEFRHQHPAGPYVLDFYCPAAKLAIEMGLWLRGRGYRVLRIPASELRGNAEGVLQHILNVCAA